MNSRLHVAALLALAVLLVVVLVRCAGGDGPAPAPEPVGFEPEAEVEEGPGVGALATSGDAGERSEVEPATEAPGEADAARRAEPAAPQDMRTLHVVVRSETGAPIEGARVGYVRTPDGAIDPRATFDVDEDSELVHVVRTDANGRCRLDRPESRARAVVDARAEGRYPLRLPDFGDDRELRFVLTAHAEVFGRVVDSETGAGIAEATVWSSWFFEIDPEHGIVTTDADGGFGPLRAPAGTPFRLTVRAAGYVDHSGHPTAPAATDSPDVMEIALRPARSLTVRVLDARNGQPISGAKITSGSEHLERETTTDADGVAELDDVLPATREPDPGSKEFDAWLAVRAAEHCDIGVDLSEASVDSKHFVEVPLEPDNVVHIRAVAAEGERLAGRRLLVRLPSASSTDQHGAAHYDPSVSAIEEPLSWLLSHELHGEGELVELGPDGIAVVRNLPPGLVGLEVLSVDDERRLFAEVGPFESTGEIREVVVSLDR